MDNQPTEQEIELILLAYKSRFIYYNSGVALGFALSLASLDFAMGKVTVFSLSACLFAGIALALYQWSGRLGNKMIELSSKIKGDKDAQV